MAASPIINNLRNSIRIITIEREYGSGAAEIAKRVGERLGWKVWDQSLTREIARLANCDQSMVERKEERRDPMYYRLLKSFMRGSYEGSVSVGPVEMLDSDNMVSISERVVQRAADEGNCVIVGRGSQHFLQNRKDTLRFFLYAPYQSKVRRLTAQGMKETEAEALIDSVDRERAAFIKEYFGVEWPNRAVYHAMFNTAVGEECVVKAILCYLEREC